MSENERKETEKVRLRDKIKNLWRKIDWRNPLHRWQLAFFIIVFLVLAFGGSYGALKATGTNQFCASCHVHPPEAISHELTTHKELYCTDCHVEPGLDNYLMSKVAASPKMYKVTLGEIPDPIFMKKEPIPNVTCQECHSQNRNVTASGDLIVNHNGHIDEGILCVTCHSGVAHGKVVERGLNESKDFDYWTEENGEEIISTEYTRPNMGTCIDCHIRYNEGETPWEDKYYSLSFPPDHEKNQSMAIYEVFERIKEQRENPKENQISMECATCHLEIDIPENHYKKNFVNNHGDDAVNAFDSCMTCHDQGKWQKNINQQSYTILFDSKQPNLEHYTPDVYVVQSLSKENSFCFSCHEERPDSHQTSSYWLTGHAKEVDSRQDVNRCLVCHDFDEAEDIVIEETDLVNLNITAPTNVTCGYCHRTGLDVE
ncbi:cytochrome c-type protein NapC [Evansella vedderi]|uniref:Cytochrome c-type protein NapC n=1 Tax=Evansella vedderi TaxID=38282 RepID=A0ABT9ZZJ6_9BACI|nr:NapC/NirT family cytochrome c [Evansella vedderi]MDQ0256665.1 cytochrome c-type protein NapC [Evansella vedderi]